jgi:uncharacterized protein (TIGR02301 family)
MPLFRSVLIALSLLIAAASPCAAQDDAPEAPVGDDAGEAAAEEGAEEAPVTPPRLPPPIYEDQLLRLSEILGALSFLRALCGQEDADTWRNEMAALLTAERPSPERRGRLIGRFNHGFETFNAVYRTCTPSAELAIARYLAEGQALASDVRSRYSQ